MAKSAFGIDIFDRLFGAPDVSNVLEVMARCCLLIGGDKFSYHPEVMFDGVTSAQTEVYSRGYPEEWVASYTNSGGKMTDPIPDIIMRKGHPMTWVDALSNIKLDAPQRAYIKEAQRYGLQSGVGFPLWGPQGQNAFAAIGFSDHNFVLSPGLISSTHVVLLAGHQKIHELTVNSVDQKVLSARECEVLTWVGKGKSGTDIATILSISPETVSTYLRRIYTKLSCHDRIGAVIKALRLGLIRI